MAKREYIQANKDWLEAKAQEEDVDCTINVIKGTTIQAMYEEDPHLMNIGKEIGEGRFLGAKIQKQFVKCDILHKKLLLNAIFCIPIRFS